MQQRACAPSSWRKDFNSSPLRWSKIRTEPSSLPPITQSPCNAEVICRGTLLQIGWRKVCCKVGGTPGDTSDTRYESIPLTRLEIRTYLWSAEKVAYPLTIRYFAAEGNITHHDIPPCWNFCYPLLAKWFKSVRYAGAGWVSHELQDVIGRTFHGFPSKIRAPSHRDRKIAHS